jgi:hypothetical protein
MLSGPLSITLKASMPTPPLVIKLGDFGEQPGRFVTVGTELPLPGLSH